jgi:hypothetical protein
VLHWTFLLEILMWIMAIYVYMQWPVVIARIRYDEKGSKGLSSDRGECGRVY